MGANSPQPVDSSMQKLAADEEQSLLHDHPEKVKPAVSRSGMIRVLLAAAVATGWMFVSGLLIMVNKHILKDLKFG